MQQTQLEYVRQRHTDPPCPKLDQEELQLSPRGMGAAFLDASLVLLFFSVCFPSLTMNQLFSRRRCGGVQEAQVTVSSLRYS